MKLVYENAKEFDSLLRRVAVVLTEANLVVGLEGEGVLIRDFDPARVVMVELQMGSELFETYEVDEPVIIGISLDEMKEITKRANKGDQLTLEYEPGSAFKIIFQGDRKRTFKFTPLELEYEEVPAPALGFDARLSVKASQLSEFIKDAAIVDTHYGSGTVFEVQGASGSRTFAIKVESDLREYEGMWCEGEEGIEFESEVEIQTSKYTIRYLKDMVHTHLGETVLVEFSSDMPLRLSYSFGGSGGLTYLLAPRIEED